jgi:hypothetical protein
MRRYESVRCKLRAMKGTVCPWWMNIIREEEVHGRWRVVGILTDNHSASHKNWRRDKTSCGVGDMRLLKRTS